GLKEKSIIVFTSKIISIWQGRCIKINLVKDKDVLIKKEAELYLERKNVPKGYVVLTIKNNTLIPTAGIDESNGNGYYILWPKNLFSTAKKIYKFIKKNYNLKEFGIIISDSHCVPLRVGTLGISLAYYGFEPLKDYRGKKDIFGRKFKISQLNLADSLSAAATLIMGEGREQTPIAIIEGLGFIKFKEPDSVKSNPIKIAKEEDIYAPLLAAIKWKTS
ncbi:coenzyme F420-0:L-glutamate ligase, partial [Patescibacteria group bacterium]|nr:coenzyme F420-0:L-glutamate ligase [Patescibacteria group bacterium]